MTVTKNATSKHHLKLPSKLKETKINEKISLVKRIREEGNEGSVCLMQCVATGLQREMLILHRLG